jgi:hypothetical protein
MLACFLNLQGNPVSVGLVALGYAGLKPSVYKDWWWLLRLRVGSVRMGGGFC